MVKHRCRKCQVVHPTETECIQHLSQIHGEDLLKLRRNDWYRRTLIERCSEGAIDLDQPLPFGL